MAYAAVDNAREHPQVRAKALGLVCDGGTNQLERASRMSLS